MIGRVQRLRVEVECSTLYESALALFDVTWLAERHTMRKNCARNAFRSIACSRKPIKFMTSRQAKLQEDTYFRVMRILQDNPDLTQRELAEKLGVSVGGLNYCLKALIEKGLVKMKNFTTSKNKFGYVYVLTPTGMAEKAAITHRFLLRKMDEYEALKAEIEVLRSEVEKPGDQEAQKA